LHLTCSSHTGSQKYKVITDDVIDGVLSEVGPSQLGLNEKQCAAMEKLVDPSKRDELQKEVRLCRAPPYCEDLPVVELLSRCVA
jgi:hypothetical protein